MDIIEQPIETGNPSGTGSSVSPELLLDTLAALSDEVAELPALLGLFATGLEAGLAGPPGDQRWQFAPFRTSVPSCKA